MKASEDDSSLPFHSQLNNTSNLFFFQLKTGPHSPDRMDPLNGLNGLNSLNGLNALEMQRNLALWQLYNNASPANNAPSPHNNEPQR